MVLRTLTLAAALLVVLLAAVPAQAQDGDAERPDATLRLTAGGWTGKT